MGGAYTSKPEEEISYPAPPDIPVNWNPEWTFPGPPYSPGYDPEYVLSVSGPDELSPEDSAVLQSKLVDRQGNESIGYTEYVGNKRLDEEYQTWSATLDGALVQLKPSGGAFGDEIQVPYTMIGLFQGCVEDVEFDVTADDIGKFIEVLFNSLTGGEETHEIEVKGVTIYGIVYAGDGTPKPGATVSFTSVATAVEKNATCDGSGYYEVTFLLEDDADGYTVIYDAADETAKNTTVDAKGALGEFQEDFYFGEPTMSISTDMFWSSTDSEKYYARLDGGSAGALEIEWTKTGGFNVNEASGDLTTLIGATSGWQLSLGTGHFWFDGSIDTAGMALLEGASFTFKVYGERDSSPLPGDLLMSWQWLWRSYRGVSLFLTGESEGDQSYWIPPAGMYQTTETIGTITEGVIE